MQKYMYLIILLIDWLVFNTNVSNISALLYLGVNKVYVNLDVSTYMNILQ